MVMFVKIAVLAFVFFDVQNRHRWLSKRVATSLLSETGVFFVVSGGCILHCQSGCLEGHPIPVLTFVPEQH